eukprot:6198817-Pleurochrysis_carterae.AAC.4
MVRSPAAVRGVALLKKLVNRQWRSDLGEANGGVDGGILGGGDVVVECESRQHCRVRLDAPAHDARPEGRAPLRSVDRRERAQCLCALRGKRGAAEVAELGERVAGLVGRLAVVVKRLAHVPFTDDELAVEVEALVVQPEQTRRRDPRRLRRADALSRRRRPVRTRHVAGYVPGCVLLHAAWYATWHAAWGVGVCGGVVARRGGRAFG